MDLGEGAANAPHRIFEKAPYAHSIPLTWQMSAVPVPCPDIPAVAERGGAQLKTPRLVILFHALPWAEKALWSDIF